MAIELEQVVGIGAGLCTATSLLPQLVKLIRTKSSEDISILFLSILFTGLCLWIWYGFLKSDLPIIATNTFSLIINALIFVLGLRYRKNKSKN